MATKVTRKKTIAKGPVKPFQPKGFPIQTSRTYGPSSRVKGK